MIAAEAPAGRGARRANTAAYSTDEQRSPAGWIGGEGVRVVSRRALTPRALEKGREPRAGATQDPSPGPHVGSRYLASGSEGMDPKGWIRPFLQSAHPGGSDSDHQKLREAAEVLVPGEQGEIMLHCGILAQWNS